MPALAPRSAELRLLAGDLENDDRRLEQWAELDLVNTFVRPESLTVPAPPAPTSVLGRVRRYPGREHALEIALGAMIFVPLLVTWFGLWEAIRAYGDLARKSPEQATRPFLQLWQSGFGGELSGFARFENIALTAVLIISGLVLLSILHIRTRAQTERTAVVRHVEHTALLGELAAVLTNVQLELVPHRSVSPDRFTTVLTDAATKLDDAIAESEERQRLLTDTATSTGKATQELKAATTVLKDAADALTAGIQPLTGAADRIERAVQSAEQAAALAAKDASTAALAMADRLKDTIDTLRTALDGLATSQKALTDRSQSVVDAADRAAQALVGSGDSTDRAVTGMVAATDRWDAAAAHWEDAAARLDSGVRALMDRLSVLGAAGNGAATRTDPGADR
ncbi:hypothetical protein [Actinomadura sp. 3N508]|uniref:hypothetical protein n=1 Tax=Actinomadura sp. 3N508 TaxID=3375153 RepID=UPI0037BF040D